MAREFRPWSSPWDRQEGGGRRTQDPGWSTEPAASRASGPQSRGAGPLRAASYTGRTFTTKSSDISTERGGWNRLLGKEDQVAGLCQRISWTRCPAAVKFKRTTTSWQRLLHLPWGIPISTRIGAPQHLGDNTASPSSSNARQGDRAEARRSSDTPPTAAVWSVSSTQRMNAERHRRGQTPGTWPHRHRQCTDGSLDHCAVYSLFGEESGGLRGLRGRGVGSYPGQRSGRRHSVLLVQREGFSPPPRRGRTPSLPLRAGQCALVGELFPFNYSGKTDPQRLYVGRTSTVFQHHS